MWIRGYYPVSEALKAESFPMNKAGVNYSVGDIEVEDGTGGYIAVEELTDFISQESFDSPREVIQALLAAAAVRREGYPERAA